MIMNITVARFLLENNVYKDCGMVRIPTVYYEQIINALKEQELRVCCLCGYFDTVENRCKFHKHDVDVSESCSRWVKRDE